MPPESVWGSLRRNHRDPISPAVLRLVKRLIGAFRHRAVVHVASFGDPRNCTRRSLPAGGSCLTSSGIVRIRGRAEAIGSPSLARGRSTETFKNTLSRYHAGKQLPAAEQMAANDLIFRFLCFAHGGRAANKKKRCQSSRNSNLTGGEVTDISDMRNQLKPLSSRFDPEHMGPGPGTSCTSDRRSSYRPDQGSFDRCRAKTFGQDAFARERQRIAGRPSSKSMPIDLVSTRAPLHSKLVRLSRYRGEQSSR
jgi:hypothetical protein